MPTPPDPIMPTATADVPGQTPVGDYLAPPPALRMPLSRSLPILLLCGTLLFNLLYLLSIQRSSSYKNVDWFLILPVSVSLLILQFFAIFRSHTWPTYALWLALAGIVAGFSIII